MVQDRRHHAETWKEAKMVLIAKKGKNLAGPDSAEAYWLMSVLNMDYKILTSILADWLNKVLGKYVVEDQTGFLKHCYLKDNIRKVVNIMGWAQKDLGSTLMYLDAEKAFDRVEWQNCERTSC